MASLIRPIFHQTLRPKEVFQKLYRIVEKNAFNTFIVDVERLGLKDDDFKCRDYCWILGTNAEKRSNSVIYNNTSPMTYDRYQHLINELIYLNEKNLVAYKSYVTCLNHSPTMYHRDMVIANNYNLNFGSFIKPGNHCAFKYTGHDVIKEKVFRSQNLNEIMRIHSMSEISKNKDILLDKRCQKIEKIKLDDDVSLEIIQWSEIIDLFC